MEIHKDPEKSKSLCVVIDTNIFIKNLSKLKDILDMKITGNKFLYITYNHSITMLL